MNKSMFIEGDEDSTPAPKRETEDLRIKYYQVDLPSKGKLNYPETIEYRDILVRDEKILSSSATSPEQYQKVLNSVLKSLLKNPEDYEKFSLYDRDYLLLWVWANSYTPEQTFDTTCPSCGSKEKITVDYTKLAVTDLEDDFDFPFQLEISNDRTIGVKFITVGDEETAANYVKRNKNMPVEHVLLALSVELDTKMPLEMKMKHIEETFTGRDWALVRAFHKHFKYGVELEESHVCSSCGHEARFPVPINAEFFMPTLQDDFEAMLRSNKASKHKSS